MDLTDEQSMVRDMARAFAQQELAPSAAEWDQAASLPRAVLDRMGAQKYVPASASDFDAIEGVAKAVGMLK